MNPRKFLPLLFAAPLLALAQAQPAPAPAAPAEQPAAPAAAAPAVVPATPAVTPAPRPDVVVAPATPATTVAKEKDTQKDTLKVEFSEPTDIREILVNVAALFDLNIHIPDTLQGKTTLALHDVTWKQIFKTVLSPVNFTFIEDGNIIEIVSQDALDKEPTTTEVFPVNYAKASDLGDPAKGPVAPMLTPAAGEKLIVDARTNSLVITARPSVMAKLRPIIKQLDRATDQVMIESKFVEVRNSDVENLGVKWASLSGVGLNAGNLQSSVTRTTDQQKSNNFSNGANNQTGATNTTSNTNGNSNNFNLTSGSSGNTNSLTVTNTQSSAAGNGSNAASTNTLDNLTSLLGARDIVRETTAVFSATDFNLVLSALQTLGGTKVVSNPTIVTLNNSEAVINVGEEHPIPEFAYNDQRGTFEVKGFTYRPIGVILKVTPQVNGLGDIRLTLAPEVSQPNGNVTFGGAAGTEIPIIASRKATTSVSIRDGYTMGIGGLLTSNAVTGGSKVPILGDIPVIGRLFSSKSHDVTTTNLLIFITARAVSSQGAPAEVIFNSEKVRSTGLTREELPGYRDGTDPFAPLPMPPKPATSTKSAAPTSRK